MPNAMRAVFDRLGELEAEANASLWWQKYLPKVVDGVNPKEDEIRARFNHIQSFKSIKTPEEYPSYCDRYRNLVERSSQSITGVATCLGRVILGIGEETALEAGLRLHHTWGVPFLPGTALKGVAAAMAASVWPESTEEYKYIRFLFGDAEIGDEGACAGAVIFHDALWEPEGPTLPILPDVVTVHYSDYYQQKKDPSDKTMPIPISFASINGSYRIQLTARAGVWGNSEGQECSQWLDVAMRLLKLGLEELGIGAKTSAGYGRMSLEYQLSQEKYENTRRENMSPEEIFEEDLRGEGEILDSEWIRENGREIPGSFSGDETQWKAHIHDKHGELLQELRGRLKELPNEDDKAVAKRKRLLAGKIRKLLEWYGEK
jgi:CRISPR-associated protein Cmr6